MIKNAEIALLVVKDEAEEIIEGVYKTLPIDNYLQLQDIGHSLKAAAEALEDYAHELLEIGYKLEDKDIIDG